MFVVVHHLSSGAELTYGPDLTPRQAVLNAFALHDRKDGSWDRYEERYGHLVQTGRHTVGCGDYAARLTPAPTVIHVPVGSVARRSRH